MANVSFENDAVVVLWDTPYQVAITVRVLHRHCRSRDGNNVRKRIRAAAPTYLSTYQHRVYTRYTSWNFVCIIKERSVGFQQV